MRYSRTAEETREQIARAFAERDASFGCRPVSGDAERVRLDPGIHTNVPTKFVDLTSNPNMASQDIGTQMARAEGKDQIISAEDAAVLSRMVFGS